MHISISKVNFTSIGINIAKVDFGRYDSGGEPQLNGLYITPADASAINVTPNDSYYTIHGKYLKYSLNGKKWKDWNGSVTIEPGQKIYLKGEDDYVWDRYTSGKLITADGHYNVGGDISSLTNFIAEVKNETFRFLFEYDSYIKDASNLILPATTLANSCYGSMFHGCTSLTTAPALHATTLAESCYSNMFNGCTSLTTAPVLPAATLTPYCYYYMFNGCTALTTAPELPATTLAEACYYEMFSGCTSLTAAPELPATTLAKFCYGNMFNGCTSLTTAPELHATTLADNCYYHMFNGCTSLTTAPELPATKLLDNCYRGMFYGCSKLNNITMLATDISASNCLNNWVNGVAPTGTFTKAASMTTLPTGVNGIPEGWTVADYTEYMTLSALNDGEITITIPAAINSSYATSLSYSKDKSNWTETIIDDTAQTITIPVTSGENVYLKGIAKQLGNSSTGVNINSTANIDASGNTMSLLYGDDYKDKVAFQSGSEYTFMSLFRGNTHLISAENLILTATTLAFKCYDSMFYDCTSLTAAPELQATTLAIDCYSNMFSGCTSLTTAPELQATILADGCYYNMFSRCTSLITAPELPATTLTEYCYSNMFNSCYSLTTAPELPATTLANSCYSNMFTSCTSLNSITMLATEISAPNCLYNWVSGVAPTGTFTKSPEMTSLPTGNNGIPEGWTVKDYTDDKTPVYEVLDYIITPSRSEINTEVIVDGTTVVEMTCILKNRSYNAPRFFSSNDTNTDQPGWNQEGTWGLQFEDVDANLSIKMLGADYNRLGSAVIVRTGITYNDLNNKKLRYNLAASGILTIFNTDDTVFNSYDATENTDTSVTSSTPIKLFHRFTPNEYINDGTYVYDVKIWKNDVLIRHYLPVKRLSDNVYGLYDNVNNTFHQNEVSGYSFTGTSKSTPEYIY